MPFADFVDVPLTSLNSETAPNCSIDPNLASMPPVSKKVPNCPMAGRALDTSVCPNRQEA